MEKGSLDLLKRERERSAGYTPSLLRFRLFNLASPQATYLSINCNCWVLQKTIYGRCFK